MKRRAMWQPLVGAGIIGALALFAWANDGVEEEVTIDQVPAAVRATILKEAAGAEIREIERETRDGRTTYEAEWVVNGQEIEIKVADDGTLLGREVEADDDDDLKLADVPAPVRATLLKLAGDARISEIERETKGGAEVYEAMWVTHGVRHEAEVLADGTLLETEESVDGTAVPAAVQAAVTKHFPGDAKVKIVKKMIVVYEAETRINGKEAEVLILPTGRIVDNHDDEGADDHGDDDDDDDDDD